MNFFGGSGEAAHKFFKVSGLKTRWWVSEFAVQMANQYYDIMVTHYAWQSLEQEQHTEGNETQSENSIHQLEEVRVFFCGKYSLVVTNVILQSKKNGDKIYVESSKDEKKVKNYNYQYCLDSQYLRVLTQDILIIVIILKGIQGQAPKQMMELKS